MCWWALAAVVVLFPFAIVLILTPFAIADLARRYRGLLIVLVVVLLSGCAHTFPPAEIHEGCEEYERVRRDARTGQFLGLDTVAICHIRRPLTRPQPKA